jgi:hypothetical protein
MSNYTIEVTENVVNLDVLKDHDIIIEIKSSDNFITFETPSGYPILSTSGTLPIDRVASGYPIDNLSGIDNLVRIFNNNINIGGLITASSGNFTNNLNVNGTGVSISGHTHTSSDITDFNSSVSGLIDVKDIAAGSNVTVYNNDGIFTISSSGGVNPVSRGVFLLNQASGSFTVDGGYSVGSLDVFMNGIKLSLSGDYVADDGLSFSLSETAPSGSLIEYLALSPGLSFSSRTISDFNSSVSGLLPVKNIISGTNITVNNNNGTFAINSAATISNSRGWFLS